MWAPQVWESGPGQCTKLGWWYLCSLPGQLRWTGTLGGPEMWVSRDREAGWDPLTDRGGPAQWQLSRSSWPGAGEDVAPGACWAQPPLPSQVGQRQGCRELSARYSTLGRLWASGGSSSQPGEGADGSGVAVSRARSCPAVQVAPLCVCGSWGPTGSCLPGWASPLPQGGGTCGSWGGCLPGPLTLSKWLDLMGPQHLHP